MRDLKDVKKAQVVKLSPEVKSKIDKMSEVLAMPRSQCINMLVTAWLKENVENEDQEFARRSAMFAVNADTIYEKWIAREGKDVVHNYMMSKLEFIR